ncbi:MULTISPECIES: very short patch repair endonuclease [Acidaminococcus]|jgi:DNA mismatch endonuclease (patch repair protein)|uniref:very short patch repair endonuclease n=1 Tax=Acidaminococcus TaxID=904 RepID=UPI0023F37807|nr:very short patch repair endonuclease [Acidaminococcus massiliensis]
MTAEQRRATMQHIRSSDTKAERMLRLALWHHGIRYRKNWKKIPGKPDIVLTKFHIAIFVDGDFWHARHHENNPGEQIKSNKEYWVPKLKQNVARDKEINNELSEKGWLVLRFWESDIKKNLEGVIDQIISSLPPKKK